VNRDMVSKDVRIKPCPVDGNECSRGKVPQERQCQTKQNKPGKHIRKRTENENYSDSVIGEGSNGWGKAGPDDGDRECGDRGYSDSQGCNTPEFLLCVSGERKVPPRTMNATKCDAKGNQEKDVEPLGESMLWNVVRWDVLVVRGE